MSVTAVTAVTSVTAVTAVTNLKIRIEIDPQEKSARSFLRVVFDAESFGDSPRAPFSRLSTLPVK